MRITRHGFEKMLIHIIHPPSFKGLRKGAGIVQLVQYLSYGLDDQDSIPERGRDETNPAPYLLGTGEFSPG